MVFKSLLSPMICMNCISFATRCFALSIFPQTFYKCTKMFHCSFVRLIFQIVWLSTKLGGFMFAYVCLCTIYSHCRWLLLIVCTRSVQCARTNHFCIHVWNGKTKHKLNRNINYSSDFIVSRHKLCVFWRIPHHLGFFFLSLVLFFPVLCPFFHTYLSSWCLALWSPRATEATTTNTMKLRKNK